MSRVESSTTIGAPPEAIQAALENVETAHEWAPSLQKVWDVQGRGTGCTYKWTFKLGPASFDGSTEITESTPERFVMKTTGGIPSTWTWQMAPDGNGTELTVTIDYTVPGSALGALADKLVVEKQNRKELETSLATLKAKLES
jgi:carbon monoxide dehydrogenase subunit G